ncbi:hypothetical protein Fmac_030759 [Flemingia macrophylla]|uniref:Uncharacterized protein n=1 Tax=Flemingia macrophylla TaxID=520843 RepID=A0ABD1L0J6_9FABA
MENLCEVTPSKPKESKSSFYPIMVMSPTPPESTPSSSNLIISFDGKSQSQSQNNHLPNPMNSDIDNFEITEDGKRKNVSDVWNHFKRKIVNG